MVNLFSEDVSGTKINPIDIESMNADELARQQVYENINRKPVTPYLDAFVPAEMQNVQFARELPNEPYSSLRANQPSSIVGGMFSPEISRAQEMDYMLKRQAGMQNEAMAFAQLTPMQQAQFGFYRGGQQLGDVLGGALGGKDPQLQMIGLQQQILSELDPSDPEQQLRVAQKYARTAPDLAMKIADSARTALVRIKQAQSVSRQGITPKIQVAERIATDEGLKVGTQEYKQRVAQLLQSPDNLSEAERKGARVAQITRLLTPGGSGLLLNQAERAALEAELATYERPDKQLSLTSDRDAISAELYDNKPFAQITPAQKAVVNKRVEEEERARAPKMTVDLKDPTATAKASLEVMSKWEGFLSKGGDVEVANRYKAVQSAVAMANAGNPTADGALLYNIAKMYDPSGAVQEGDKKSITGNPAIPERFKLLVQGVLDGGSFTPTQRKDLEKIANGIVKNRESQLNVYRKQYIKKNTALGGTEEDILNPYQGLIKPPLSEFRMETQNTNPNNILGGDR